MHFVYIIQSLRDQSFYVGYSSKPEERLAKHNRPHKGYTARKQPWKLVHLEKFEPKPKLLKEKNTLKLKSQVCSLKN